MTKTPERPR
jgi:hypothetical protein